MGLFIKNINKILKDNNIVCCECFSKNIIANHKPFETKENGIIYHNQEMICKDCGKKFLFTVENDSEDYEKFQSVFNVK